MWNMNKKKKKLENKKWSKEKIKNVGSSVSNFMLNFCGEDFF